MSPTDFICSNCFYILIIKPEKELNKNYKSTLDRLFVYLLLCTCFNSVRKCTISVTFSFTHL